MNLPYDIKWLDTLEQVAIRAGELIMQFRASGFETMRKGDRTPVTEADRAADALICEALYALTPDISVISEEGAQEEQKASSGRFWCVDPLDGTKGFIRGEDEFTVNIGLIDEFTPVMGVIYIPAQKQLYAGAVNHGAYRIHTSDVREKIKVRKATEGQKAAVTSLDHGASKEREMTERYGINSFVAASSSLKFCRIAEGEADIYPRFGTTMEWDTAAGHAIVLAAGGSVHEMDSEQPLRYGKKGFYNPHFIVRGK